MTLQKERTAEELVYSKISLKRETMNLKKKTYIHF